MNLKKSPFAIQDKNIRDLDNPEDYPTIADLMREQNPSNDKENTVHYRRDLDSLGQFMRKDQLLVKKSIFSIWTKEEK